ncbi:MAG: carbohydrate-binding protein [Paludibacteraceae bacterium]|nr:carbohydrate-binding protein [Paludibacteraceae bacterium]
MKKAFFLIVALLLCEVASAAKFNSLKSIQTGGKNRQYYLYVPNSITDDRPLVISCHGMNQDYNYQKEQTQWPNFADTANFVVVYPVGIAGTAWGQSFQTGWDLDGMSDVNFILDIIADVKKDYNIDETRVYLSGFSLGGAFTYYMMNKAADKIAAFGPISGYNLMGGSTSSSRPIPICHVHGTADDIMNYGGIKDNMRKYAQAQNCNMTPIEKTGNGYSEIRYTDGDCETEVVLYSVNGRGHEPSNNGFNTSQALWTFFRQYTTACGKAASTGVSLSLSENIGEAPATVTLSAKATLPDGASVKSIEFYQGSKLLETLTNEPFEVTVQDLEIGKYEFSAVMVDNEGKSYNSAKKNFEVKAPQAPYKGIASDLPGAVEMENYDEGGEGMAFHDSDEVDEGKAFRTEDGVDIEEFATGKYALGWTKKGEWVEYTLNVLFEDTYNWTAYAASGSDGSSFKLYIDDKAISESISVKNSGDWKTFKEYTGKTGELAPGKHILKVEILADYVNIDKVEFESEHEHVGLSEASSNDVETAYEIYSLQGTLLTTLTSTEAGVEGALQNKGFRAGTYLVKAQSTGLSKLVVLKK